MIQALPARITATILGTPVEMLVNTNNPPITWQQFAFRYVDMVKMIC